MDGERRPDGGAGRGWAAFDAAEGENAVRVNFDVQRLSVGQGEGWYGEGRVARATGGAHRSRHGSGDVRKKEVDGEHPASHYLVVGDPKRPSTWHLRVRDANGQLDHRLMGAAWAALHGGFRGEKYEGPNKQEALRALKRLYESEGMETPGSRGEEASEARETEKPQAGVEAMSAGRRSAVKFVATLAEAPAQGVVRIPLAVTGTWARGAEKFSITRQDLEAIARNFARRRNGEINVDYDHASEMPEVAAGGPIPSAGRIVKIDPPEAAEGQGSPGGVASGNDGAKAARSQVRGGGAAVSHAFTSRLSGLPAARRHGARYILWGWYEPTERARALIRRREYRYISPAIDWGARSKRTGLPQGATLTSVALTNRPFLEELPQIHLSDPSYRLVGAGTGAIAKEGRGSRQGGNGATAKLIDVGDVHVDTSLPDFSVAVGVPETWESRPSRRDGSDGTGKAEAGRKPANQRGGAFMKKVEVSAADGKVALTHPDFTDEYYADPEELQEVLEEMGLTGDPAEAGAEEIPLEQAAAALSEAETRGKRVAAEEIFRARVEQALEEAVKSGKILPRQRGEWRRVGLSDFATFSKLLSEQPARVPLRPVGFASAGPADVGAQVKFLAEQRMRERGISYGQALTELGREQPDLIQKYRRAVSGE